MQVIVTLHRQGLEPVHARATLGPDAAVNNPELRNAKVTISTGDDLARGAVTVPLDLLSVLMAKVMGQAGSQATPQIVIPN